MHFATTASAETTQGRWRGQLTLHFEQHSGQTVMVRSRHEGPLRVQRPFREPTGACQVYILNPPGGVVSGDELVVSAHLAEGARTLLTAPGATKFYRSGGGVAEQRQEFTLERGSHLEWLPQETIVFEGAKVRQETRVHLARGASFVGWEVTCLGRPAAQDRFGSGKLEQRWELWEDERLLWKERTALDATDAVRSSAWGWANRPVLGTMVLHPVSPAALDLARSCLAPEHHEPAPEADWTSATLLDRTLLCRYLGASSARARATFTRIWSALRPTEFGCAAVTPRIWAT